MTIDLGFPLPEYVTPKTGLGSSVPGGTMAKSSRDDGSMFAEITRRTGVGPEHYQKDLAARPFTKTTKGGQMSKLARSHVGSSKTPPVGLYDTCPEVPIKGGMWSKKETGSFFSDQAVRQNKWRQAPGKYEGEKITPRVKVPTFSQAVTESKTPRKASGLGPGYYQLNCSLVEERVPSWTASKENKKCYLDAELKAKAGNPPPGHAGIPDSKLLDREGIRKHTKHMLKDGRGSKSKPPTPR